MPATTDSTSITPETTPVQKTKRSLWMVSVHVLIQVLFAVVALVLCLECMFALAGIGEQEYLRIDKEVGFAPMENKHVTWRKEGFSRTTFNSQGLPDRELSLSKPANTYRIAVIGDSFTEALQVDRTQNFCSLLEKKLNQESGGAQRFEVINGGCSAYNLGQMYYRLKNKVMPYQPDLVLVAMSVDTIKNFAHMQGGFAFANARPTFVIDDQGQLRFDYRIFDIWRLSPEGKRIKNTNWLRQYSHIWGVLGTIMGNLDSYKHDIISGKIWGWGTTQQALMTVQSSAKPGAAVVSESNDKAIAMPLPAPVQGPVINQTQELWPVAQAVLREMKKDCLAHDSKFVMVRLAGRPEVGYVNPQETEMFKGEASSSQTPYIDLSETFDKAKTDGKTLFYSVHLAPEGHQIVATELNRFLNSSNLLQK